MNKNRRNILKTMAVAGVGAGGLSYMSRPSMAVEGWNAENPQTIQGGSVSSLEIPESGFDFTFEWSGFGAGTHSIDLVISTRSYLYKS